VFVQEPTFSGCLVYARPVGLFRMWDEKGRDEKILCVPLRDPTGSQGDELGDIQGTLLAEVEHFFAVYKDLEGKPTGTEGFEDRAAAVKVIAEARARASEGSARS
jgi:inorganic pyrophosphatase